VGIYDRDYYRRERSSFALRLPRSAVITLIVINVIVYVADALLPSYGRATWSQYYCAATVGTLTKPYLWWQFLTYGFVHDRGPSHILFNMLGLWFLGRDVEEVYGSREFTRLYLAIIFVAGLAWAAAGWMISAPAYSTVFGASGAIAGLVVLYALHFPRRIILFMFVIPMPAWVFGLLVVLSDVLGATGYHPESRIAYGVHLAGAAFAFIYYQQGWNFGRLFQGRFHFRWPHLGPRPRLQVHQPENADDDDISDEEVDRILEKIHREGESSLSRKERRILQHASREYQRRRQGM
jgi:membrane associated rhomboid family serine protease